MAIADHQAPISAALEQIEGLILPCLTLTLDGLLGQSSGATDPRAFAASLRGVADELEGLTRLIERNPAAGLVGSLPRPHSHFGAPTAAFGKG